MYTIYIIYIIYIYSISLLLKIGVQSFGKKASIRSKIKLNRFKH